MEIIALLGLKSPFSVRGEQFFLNIKKIKIGNCSIYVHILRYNGGAHSGPSCYLLCS
jgi:hypothetical protein